MESCPTKLTKDQANTLKAVIDYFEKKRFAPTVGELALTLKKTRSTVHGNLDQLIKKGYLTRTAGKARSIEIVQLPSTKVIGIVEIPVLGSVTAGCPVMAEQNFTGYVAIEATHVGSGDYFALEVTGDSMIDADIQNGDMVIVRQQQIAESGDIVVASIDSEITVKRLMFKSGTVWLVPENSEFKPIEILGMHDFRILGKVSATRRPLKIRN